jgi:hypothetical protein
MENGMTKPQDASLASETTEADPARKPYKKPEVQVYGDLATITQAINVTGTPDGTGHPNKHFTA